MICLDIFICYCYYYYYYYYYYSFGVHHLWCRKLFTEYMQNKKFQFFIWILQKHVQNDVMRLLSMTSLKSGIAFNVVISYILIIDIF